MQTLIYQRSQFAKVDWHGRTRPGRCPGAGLGLYETERRQAGHHPENRRRRAVLSPIWRWCRQKNVGAFVVVTRSPLTRFASMSNGINDLVSELSRQQDIQPVIEQASINNSDELLTSRPFR
jgi:D-alanyl-D-alanine-carboxypeptidase/D-alanyl-D-alanine-endopeptidase